ncbi:uncharacterized protein LOC110858314 isoform X2 [Folsomia candida]|uniref:uncharacterized protein LOC110858314 isoform X2 n=1 Tax=Folsomia candida TaxID=158441 RepID=UPI001604B39F|nr:uncharacterized protein LOC110858314 isoform X2 [Folsomia candida]
MPPKSMKVKGDDSDSFTDYDDEMSGSDDTTPKKRPRLSKDMDTSGYESTPRRVTRSKKSGGGTSSSAARSELRGVFGNDDDVTVGESTDDDEDGLEDPDELIEEKADLNEWKLSQIDSAVGKLKVDMNNVKGAHRKLGIGHAQSFIDQYEHVKNATEVPPEMTIKDYYVKLPPPTDNQEYNNAVVNIEKQIADRKNCNIKISCPIPNCKQSLARMENAKNHVMRSHLNMRLFGCKRCPLKSWKDYSTLRRHVMNKHFDLKYTCTYCFKLLNYDYNLQRHVKLGHVTPTGKPVFFSPSKRKIDMKLFKPEYLTVKYGCTFQLYAIPWVDKNGKLVDISICITKFGDIKDVARILWNTIVNACDKIVNQDDNEDDVESENWVEMCGSARTERAKGHEMRPDLAFPLGVYGISLIVASQLKWFARLYFDCVKIMATGESKYFLQKYNQELKDLLNASLTHENMPQKNIDHVNLTGAQFNMPVDE